MTTALAPVATDDLPEYPISANVRLDSHYFLQWNLKRWRGSDFRRKVEPDVGWYGFNLFCASQDETPIGTLPCDEESLAIILNLPLEKWRALMARKISPLRGWYKVRCDNGEIRLGHKVVLEVAKEAVKGSRANEQDKARRRERKRLSDLEARVKALGAGHMLKNPGWLERLDRVLSQQFGARNRTESVVRAAMDYLEVEGV